MTIIKTLFIRTTSRFELTLKGLNPFQVGVWVQTTFIIMYFFHNLLHLDYLLCEPPHLILKFKYDNVFHGEIKGEKHLGKPNVDFFMNLGLIWGFWVEIIEL